MIQYDFSLRFTLPDRTVDPESLLGELLVAGCDDATVGIARKGRIGFEFTRAARSAERAMKSAIADVLRAIPGATLIEAAPDYVGVTDIAEVLGVSRQRVRAIIEESSSFPPPVHEGTGALYHLAAVLEWLARDRNRQVDRGLYDVACAAMSANARRERRTAPPYRALSLPGAPATRLSPSTAITGR